MNKTLMIVGMGDLAGLVLNLLAQEPVSRIVLASRNLD
jgi:glutamyl-tRNA reductase